MNPCLADLFYVFIHLNHELSVYEVKGYIIGAFYGIGWGHYKMGFNSSIDNPFVQLIFEGCQGLCERRQLKKNISSEMMKKIVEQFGKHKSSLDKFRFLITCLLGFSGFLQIGKLLKLKDIHIKETQATITVTKLKTDQQREGNVV